MHRVCVFCGSSTGTDPTFTRHMVALAHALTSRNLDLVYGGGNIGLMGILADAVLAQGGKVIGVIPHSIFQKEIAHNNLTELHVVKSMHDRKAMMAEMADAFIAAPGGIGTMEEMFEIWTWGQLGFHTKPFGFLNTDGFFTSLLAFLDHSTSQGFVMERHRQMAMVETDPDRLLDRLDGFEHPGSVFSVP